jgi:hypothetical protein
MCVHFWIIAYCCGMLVFHQFREISSLHLQDKANEINLGLIFIDMYCDPVKKSYVLNGCQKASVINRHKNLNSITKQ